ncbi:hypothetical protein DEA06_16115 [Microbacterium sp. Gd 4-13]|uniref:vitamin K epoxide reductase family protein n=1 Tax=Microbacterium sp. Gd 4-13 TaxID=2173179 RepID=UPI000D587B75|nr:vitamin K epoxide reductase family protein [Microbacterium sp. Gd 4-13]PVW02016.1 hypothetical protein DEA06_16115 [Microbacterium sp. Gd 4-13]
MSGDTPAPAHTPSVVTRHAFAIFLLVTGILGLTASLALSVEKIERLLNPQTALGCDLSVLVQCSANLDSAQGAVLGFPNPFLGLVGYAAVATTGVALLATAHLARWFWVGFTLGVTFAMAFVVWLITQSVFILGTLCPWCLLVWSVTIPLFIFTTGRSLRAGVFGAGPARLGAALWPWLTLITLLAYVAVAVVAQLRLDVIGSLL